MSTVVELDRKADELPDGWRSLRLGDVARLGGGTTPARAEARYWDNATIPWATPSDITSLSLGVSTIDGTENMVTERALAECSLSLNPPGTVLMTSRATIGFAAINTVPMTTNQGFITYNAGRDLDPEFLLHWLIAQRPNLVAAAGGSTFKELSRGTAKLLPILLPPLDEQRRIAEVLRSVDEAIAAAEGVIGQLRETRGHRLETLMALPGTYRRIGEVCRLSGGFGFPIKHQGKSSGRYPFAKVSDMNRLGNEVQMRHAENYVDDVDLRTLKARTFPVGTTFFPKVGATLLTNKRRIAAVEMLVDNNVMGAVATEIDPWFLYYAFCTIDMADYVQPGAVPSVNQRTIGQIMIPVPDMAAQEEFVETMRDLDAAIDMQSGAMAQLTATKQALMADLLSGRVRVPA
ncbi:MAG: restriction endonuclease subunit S [Sphingomonas sp.]|nr:restriction endonuclease subunit S [Sphingomonas sp.]MDX3884125.1 restriction endonuclease subunit S [Sphingomonas sp.]